MQVQISWGEQFINWMYNHTKLYIRGERKCKGYMETLQLQCEVADSLRPLFDAWRKEAYLQGYRDALKGDDSIYPLPE